MIMPLQGIRIFAVCLAVIAAFLLLLAGPAPDAVAQVETTILEYDKDGRVIGKRQSEIKSKDDDSEETTNARPRTSTAAPTRRVTRGSKPAPGRDQSNPDERFVPGEIVVTNLPDGFEAGVRRLGFRILERFEMKTLDLKMIRLRIPRRQTVDQAMDVLRRSFPGILADVNTVFEPGAGRSPTASLSNGWDGNRQAAVAVETSASV